jgi:small-conductance mechanosensitive channel
MEGVYQRMLELFPAFLGALGLLVVGWLVSVSLKFVVKKLLKPPLLRLEASARFGRVLKGSRVPENAPNVIGTLVFWMVFLFFAAAAMEQLPIPSVTNFLQTLAFYVPDVLLAVVVVFVGMAAGSIVNQWITGAAGAAGVEYAAMLGRVAQIAIVAAALIVGVQQIGLESTLLTAIVSITLGVVLGGMALAFGLGSGPIVSNIMASHYVAKAYRVGDLVRVADMEGTVKEIKPTTIVLESAEGEIHVPTKLYCDRISIVLRSRS